MTGHPKNHLLEPHALAPYLEEGWGVRACALRETRRAICPIQV